MMTRKEVVKKAIHFDTLPYVPLMYYGTDRIAKTDAVMLGVQEMYGGEDGRMTEWGLIGQKPEWNLNLAL